MGVLTERTHGEDSRRGEGAADGRMQIRWCRWGKVWLRRIVFADAGLVSACVWLACKARDADFRRFPADAPSAPPAEIAAGVHRWNKNVGLGGLSSRMLDWSVRVSGSPGGLGTQITADYPRMLASLAARRMAASQRRWGKNDLSVGVLAVVGLVSVYGKSDYFSDSVLAASVFTAGVFTNRSHSSPPCPKLIRSPTSLLAAFI